jgi:hypothetical protein
LVLSSYKYTHLIERNPIMEIIIGAFALVVIGYYVFFRKKDEPKAETAAETVPYKAEPVVPAGTEATMATPAATTLDPVAVALDLEPMQISQPAKAPRKPRAPKTATPKVAQKAAPKAATKTAPKAKAAPKARTKKV